MVCPTSVFASRHPVPSPTRESPSSFVQIGPLLKDFRCDPTKHGEGRAVIQRASKIAGAAANLESLVELSRLHRVVRYVHINGKHLLQLFRRIPLSGIELVQRLCDFRANTNTSGRWATSTTAALEAGQDHAIVSNLRRPEKRCSIRRLRREYGLDQSIAIRRFFRGLIHLAKIAPDADACTRATCI